MPGTKYRLRMKSGWRGKLDSTDPESEEVEVKAGEEVDVDIKTYQALVFQYNKAEPVSVEEIEAKAKAPTKKPAGQRASKTKGKQKPDKDKMQKAASTK
jgi:hypothetical protein